MSDELHEKLRIHLLSYLMPDNLSMEIRDTDSETDELTVTFRFKESEENTE